MVQQGDVGGAAEQAASAFYAILRGVGLQAFHISRKIELAEEEGFQPHRAGIGAAAAADAEGFLSAPGGFCGEIKDGRRTLDGSGIEIGDGASHHRAAADELAGTLGHSPGVLRNVAERHADAEEIIVHLLHGQAVAGDGQGVGNQRLVLLHSLIDCERGGHVLHDRADADGQAAGTDLAVHHRLDQLLLAALRILLLERKHLDAVGQLGEGLAHGLDGLRLVLLYADNGAASAQHLLHDGCTHDYLLGALQHDAVVAGEVGFALRSVQDEALGHAPGGGIQFHMCGEGGSAEADHAAGLDLVEDGRAVFGDLGHEGVGKVHALNPLVTFHGYLDVGDGIAGQVLAGTYGLDGTGCRRVHECGYESARLGDHLSGLHLVSHFHYRLCGSTKVLCHRHIHHFRQRQHFDGASTRQLRIVRMDSADCKRYLTHC